MTMPGGQSPARHAFLVLTTLLNMGTLALATSVYASRICPPGRFIIESDVTLPDTAASKRPEPIWPSGFLDLQFLHDVVTIDDDIYYRTRLVSPDTLEAYMQHLQDYGTRNSHSSQILQAGSWLMDQLLLFGYEDVVLDPIDFGAGTVLGPLGNIVATKVELGRLPVRAH